ncbi:MAG: class I tRNA ligase family protein [Candidatus Zambryskibacteria bacterium]|nr:class I tRNA ligase family protein [Candidatus Zambryskibacteria bacterium]
MEEKNPSTGSGQEKSEVALKEEKILEFWNKNEIFKKTLEKEAPNGLSAQAGNFVFFDGPPFATGLPHYGHILPGTIKDIIPRYQTMLGKKVLRRWGWDCHGLPVENLIEKELSLGSKKDIETYGVEKFNNYAREIVFRYVDEWKKIIPRVGRWVDMENDYRTMDSIYTESVWWSFKTLYDKGLVYQGFKAMLLCPRCETTLSNFEVNQGYKDITDISVTVEFELIDTPKTYLLAWTTTPWTLPGNVALAINPDMEYVAVEGEVAGNTYILAKSRLEAIFGKNYKIIRDVNPKELIGKKYKPLFDYYNNDKLEKREKAWKVYPASFVTSEDGTGVVHIAPAFGEDDMNLGKENDLPFIQHVNRDGTFKNEVIDFAGQKVKPIEDHQKADIEIIKYLAKQGTLFAKEKIIHSYPHCWRCATPLLNYATTSWFIKVTALKDRLIELNKTISWIPEDIGQGRFGKWLEGARDWAISRSRYWGAPLPVWEKKNGEQVVVGSIEDLKKHTKKSGNKYFIMRHGEGEHNISHTISSKKDDNFHLTPKGIEQVKKTTQFLKKKEITKIISSPFVRTVETTEIIKLALNFSNNKIFFDDRLGEHNLGILTGKPVSIYHEMTPTREAVFDTRIEGGESLADVKKRTGEFLYEIDKTNQNENILLITHEHSAWALESAANGFGKKETVSFIENKDEFIDLAEIHELKFVPLPHNADFELDLHKPFIDQIELLDEEGSPLKRVSEVFDCWLESGSMPFAQYHYPFENKEEFEKTNSSLFPADFIAEGLDQTRGWFYTLLVLSVGLFDRVPYKRVVVNGLVLAEDGHKMSKSLNNYPDLMDIVNKYVKAEDFNFSEKGIDEVYKKLIQKTYNILSFYEMYPVEGEGKPKELILDTWILARLNELIETTTLSLNKYELDKASRPILDFVDDLSTWYIRRSRERFKSDNVEVRYAVSYYTAFVLREFSKVVAPFIPFLAEEVYRRVGGKKESVHLDKWPEISKIDNEIIDNMQKVREVVTGALELRQKAGHKVRQPLASLTISENFSQDLLDIIADEVNVKEVKIKEGGIKLDTELTDNLRSEGIARDIIRAIQDARKSKNLNPSQKIKLIISDAENIKLVIKSFGDMIKVPTQVTEISYSKEKQEHPISLEGHTLSISVVN